MGPSPHRRPTTSPSIRGFVPHARRAPLSPRTWYVWKNAPHRLPTKLDTFGMSKPVVMPTRARDVVVWNVDSSVPIAAPVDPLTAPATAPTAPAATAAGRASAPAPMSVASRAAMRANDPAVSAIVGASREPNAAPAIAPIGPAAMAPSTPPVTAPPSRAPCRIRISAAVLASGSTTCASRRSPAPKMPAPPDVVSANATPTLATRSITPATSAAIICGRYTSDPSGSRTGLASNAPLPYFHPSWCRICCARA